MRAFVPRRGLRNGHLMTLYSWARTRQFPRLPPPAERFFDVEPGTRVLAHCYWQPDPAGRPVVIGLHGLEGSSSAHYMLGIADKAWAAGFSAVLLNQRNCGGTEHLAPGLYHSGLTADAAHVLTELAERDGIDRIALAGYSLGGNLALKLAGRYGAAPPPALRAICAVSPILEVSHCVHALERRANVVYQWNFVKALRARMLRKARHHPGRFPLDRLDAIRTVRQFDEVFTAPHFGFRDAEDYYHQASAMREIAGIAVPSLVIAADDDPFVPVSLFDAPALRANPWITTIVTRHGGHCGFVGDTHQDGDDGYWAESAVVSFIRKQVATDSAGAYDAGVR